MNMLSGIKAMIANTVRDWSGEIPQPVERHRARHKPRFGSVKAHQRHADRIRRKRRAKRLGHH